MCPSGEPQSNICGFLMFQHSQSNDSLHFLALWFLLFYPKAFWVSLLHVQLPTRNQTGSGFFVEVHPIHSTGV